MLIVIEKLVKSRRCGILPGLCQKNISYYIWGTSFGGQSTSAA